MLEEAQEQQYWPSDYRVGPECVRDGHLARVLEQAADSKMCGFCGRQEAIPFAAPLDVLLRAIVAGLRVEFEPLEASFYTFEGELMVRTFTTEEVLRYELEDEPLENAELLDEIVRSITIDEWTRLDPLALGRENALMAGWTEFSDQIKHVTRYLFFEDPPEWAEEVSPRQMMVELGGLIDRFDRIQPLPAMTRFVRVRVHPADVTLTDLQDLGPPPVERAGANRMSPAGISMFYGSSNQETAVAEVLAHARPDQRLSDTRLTCGTFQTTQDTWILNLSDPPELPSLFDPGRAPDRPEIRFLQDFLHDIARPIIPDGREHFEYTPTQVLTEYFRYVHRSPADGPILGILYPSSVAPGGVSCVLFVAADQCCLLEEWETHAGCLLALDRDSVQTLTLKVG
jgi:hypothetical protein